jgi:hypothetical protein
MSVVEITDEDFDAYEPIENHFQEGTQLFETYGDELEFVIQHKKEHIWTQVDGYDGIYIVNGYQLANRIGYYLTNKPHDPSKDIQLRVITEETI